MQHERKERNTQLLRNQQQEAMLLKIQQRAAACCKIKTNTATMPDLRTAAHHFKSLSKDPIQKQQKKKKKPIQIWKIKQLIQSEVMKNIQELN